LLRIPKGLLDGIKQKHPDKLVIDMRLNLGGDYSEGMKYLIEPISQLTDINRKGHLFVLISPYAFSAGMSNAAQFRSHPAALLVGQTIGERPNNCQEAREMRLPDSGLTVRYSTQFYKFADADENLVRPDHEIVPTWTAFLDGRDLAMDWVQAEGR
jgi:C-terminal processing protease CtpA/Prc